MRTISDGMGVCDTTAEWPTHRGSLGQMDVRINIASVTLYNNMMSVNFFAQT